MGRKPAGLSLRRRKQKSAYALVEATPSRGGLTLARYASLPFQIHDHRHNPEGAPGVAIVLNL